MNITRHRRLNIFAGVLFSVMGFGAYGAAAYLHLTPPPPVDAGRLQGDTANCMNTLRELSLEPALVGGEIRAQRASLDNPQQLLVDASIGISSCGMRLQRFCMGPGCAVQGVSFALNTYLDDKPSTTAATVAPSTAAEKGSPPKKR